MTFIAGRLIETLRPACQNLQQNQAQLLFIIIKNLLFQSQNKIDLGLSLV